MAFRLFFGMLATLGSISTDPRDASRAQIYQDNVRQIQVQNLNPLNTFYSEINHFADLSWDEVQSRFLGLIPIRTHRDSEDNFSSSPTAWEKAVASLDWRMSPGKISPILDQGDCGSCWAFATAATVESTIAIRSGKNVIKLSEQQFLDCSSNRGGCQGGYLSRSFEYVKLSGLYPVHIYNRSYVAMDNQTCLAQSLRRTSPVQPSKIRRARIGNGERFILRSLLSGVVTVGFAVEQPFLFYKNGSYNGICAPVMNHAMVIVGYTLKDWIVRNSWGEHWGENGYVRIPRGQNKCQINSYVIAVDP